MPHVFLSRKGGLLVSSIALFITSIISSYVSENLTWTFVFMSLAILIMGVGIISLSFKSSKPDTNLSRYIFWAVGLLLCLSACYSLIQVRKDLSEDTVIIKEGRLKAVNSYLKITIACKIYGYNCVYLGDSGNFYMYSPYNSEVGVLISIDSYPHKTGPDNVFRLYLSGGTQTIIKAEIVK
jgi:hypothetical protein